MKAKLATLLICLLSLSGCTTDHCAFKNYCQKDYWGDSRFDIFGRKNCVGDTGRWTDENNGRDGYFCTGPNCRTPERVTCKDTCNQTY